MLGASLPHFFAKEKIPSAAAGPRRLAVMAQETCGQNQSEALRDGRWSHTKISILYVVHFVPYVVQQSPCKVPLMGLHGNAHMQLLYVIHPWLSLLFLCVDLYKNSLKINTWAQHGLQWTSSPGWLALPHSKEALYPTSTYPENHTNELRNFKKSHFVSQREKSLPMGQ